MMYCGSEPLLEQVWINLIDNAIKHSPKGSSIRIYISEKPKTVAVKVSDDGCGMTGEVQKHIFEKFYQGDRSHKAEGSGLGLALVKRIVELCGGRLRWRARPEQARHLRWNCRRKIIFPEFTVSFSFRAILPVKVRKKAG